MLNHSTSSMVHRQCYVTDTGCSRVSAPSLKRDEPPKACQVGLPTQTDSLQLRTKLFYVMFSKVQQNTSSSAGVTRVASSFQRSASCIDKHTPIYTHIYICMYMFIHISLFMYLYVCLCICVYMYILYTCAGVSIVFRGVFSHVCIAESRSLVNKAYPGGK